MKKNGLFMLFIICAPVLCLSQVTINPGLVWQDNSGNEIQAHGGCVLQVGNTFYWYGEDRSDNKSSQKINCYSSTDLKNWTFRKTVLSSSTPGMAEANLERPKVLYNRTTKQYVLWVHKENVHDYSQARALIANCTTPDGDFTLVKEFRPFGNMSRDCNVFQDEDGTAYFVSSARENADLVCYKLTPDYLDVAEQHMLIRGGRREAPVIFKKNGIYYLCSSATTGWGPNYNTIQKATNIYGPYGPQQGLYGADTWNSYDSQTAYVLNIKGTLIMIADRWKGWKLADSRYLWLPIRFDSKGKILPIEWGDSWTIDPATGNATAPIPATPVPNNIALNKWERSQVRF
jgi:beta-xylosidase